MSQPEDFDRFDRRKKVSAGLHFLLEFTPLRWEFRDWPAAGIPDTLAECACFYLKEEPQEYVGRIYYLTMPMKFRGISREYIGKFNVIRKALRRIDA